jgi:S1-C subfamily serine protease
MRRVRLVALMLVLPVLAAICVSEFAMGEPVTAGMHASAKSGMATRKTQGYLGVDIRDVTADQVTPLKLKDAHGAEVIHVDHDGPAGKLGLCQHDVILEMNGQQIEGQEQLRRMLRETPAGKPVTLVISRDGQQQTLTTQLADRQEVERRAWEQHLVVPDPGADYGPPPHVGNGFLPATPTTPDMGPKAHRDFLGTTTVLSASFTGAQLEVMGPQLAQFFGVEGNAGLLVRSVELNSPAADAGLRAGDVVIKVDQLAVTSGSEWTKTVHQNRGRPITLVVLRDRHEQTMTMTPDGKKRSSVTWPFSGKEHGLVAKL